MPNYRRGFVEGDKVVVPMIDKSRESVGTILQVFDGDSGRKCVVSGHEGPVFASKIRFATPDESMIAAKQRLSWVKAELLRLQIEHDELLKVTSGE